MARKRGNKRYSKAEFVTAVCINKCFICSGADLDPTFCYDLYKKKPKIFMDSILDNFMDFWQEMVGLQNSYDVADEEMLKLFRAVVCDANICKRCAATDYDVYLCIAKFMEQNESVLGEPWPKKPKRAPEPCLFAHKDVKFNEEIDRILENYSKQQNTGGGTITGY